MEYGININSLRRELSLAQAAELVARAGFTQLDYTPPLREDTWEASMKEAAAIFADNGLTVHQTHAPFNRYGRFGDRHRLYVDRCAEATEFLGRGCRLRGRRQERAGLDQRAGLRPR